MTTVHALKEVYNNTVMSKQVLPPGFYGCNFIFHAKAFEFFDISEGANRKASPSFPRLRRRTVRKGFAFPNESLLRMRLSLRKFEVSYGKP